MDKEEEVIFETQVIKSINDLNKEEKEYFKQLEDENREYKYPFRITHINSFKKRQIKRFRDFIKRKVLNQKYDEYPFMYFGKHEIYSGACIEDKENIYFNADVKHVKRKDHSSEALSKFVYHDKKTEYGYVFTHDQPCNIPVNPGLELSLKKQKQNIDLAMRDIGTSTVRDATLGLKSGDKYLKGLVIGSIVFGFVLGIVFSGYL